MTTPPPQPKGVTVILAATQTAVEGLTAQTVIFANGDDWEYNDRRVTVKDRTGKKLGEFRDGNYMGIGFRDEIKVNRIKEPVNPPPIPPAQGV